MTCYEWHLSRLSTYVKPEDQGSCCYFFQVSHTTAMINRRSKRSKETGRKSEREIEREREQEREGHGNGKLKREKA